MTISQSRSTEDSRIKHQKSDKGCPWLNGRIERFFGTFKSKLKLLPENVSFDIQRLLIEYRCWYNHLRPHDYLDGSTPAEVFTRTEKPAANYQSIVTGTVYLINLRK
ncbi:MAG: transposase [Gammaproteobacteria bacterium]|nr:transposase [Gammaproteobacteria bacterium]